MSLTVLLIRHAEKPGEVWPGPGLTLDGQPDDKSLVLRGWQRAGAWAALFGSGNNGGGDYPRPAAIYAANPDTTAEGEPSRRHYQTIRPTACVWRRSSNGRGARKPGWSTRSSG